MINAWPKDFSDPKYDAYRKKLIEYVMAQTFLPMKPSKIKDPTVYYDWSKEKGKDEHGHD